MKVQPLGDRVIVDVILEEEQTVGGIVLPDSARNDGALFRATVIAAGEGRYNESGVRIPLTVSIGDEVHVSRYGGVEIEIEGETYFLVRETDIMAVVLK